jgi:hypothetical protein
MLVDFDLKPLLDWHDPPPSRDWQGPVFPFACWNSMNCQANEPKAKRMPEESKRRINREDGCEISHPKGEAGRKKSETTRKRRHDLRVLLLGSAPNVERVL